MRAATTSARVADTAILPTPFPVLLRCMAWRMLLTPDLGVSPSNVDGVWVT